MAGHVQLKFVMTKCSKTQICLTGLRYKALNNEQQYKLWLNKGNKLIKKSKNIQYRSLVEENNNQPSNVWKIFKDLGATKNKSR